MEKKQYQDCKTEPPEAQQQALVTLYQQRKFNDLVSQINQLLKQFPNSIFLLNTLGSVNTRLGQLDTAIMNFERIIEINPNYTDAYLNLGIVLKNQGNLDAAIATYKQALDINPDIAEIRCKLGDIFAEQGNLNAAIDSYKQAITIKPDYVEAYYNLGNSLWKNGDIETAIDIHKKAIKISPEIVVTYFSLAQILETSNRINELSSLLEDARTQFDKLPAKLKYYEALVLWREGKYEDGLYILDSLILSELPAYMLPAFFKLKGECNDKLKKFDDAFECFNQMNNIIKSSKRYQTFKPDEYLNIYTSQYKQLQTSSYEKNEKSENSGQINTPVFLVGFPRSGTTLLDTILRSHSRICIVEEKPMLVSAKRSINLDNNLEKIENINDQEVAVAIRAYSDELEKHIAGSRNDRFIIDKLPLNILEMPLIHSLFPKSKIILAVRHPFDSILSCWIQNFGLNHAMANMVDLGRIVDLYCLAMNTLKACACRYNLAVHLIKYEGIVHDLKTETTMLLNFLGLEWEDHLENYRETAIERGRINTPSYTQVIRPLYKDSVYRWESYRAYFDKYFQKIQPWANEFGYRL